MIFYAATLLGILYSSNAIPKREMEGGGVYPHTIYCYCCVLGFSTEQYNIHQSAIKSTIVQSSLKYYISFLFFLLLLLISVKLLCIWYFLLWDYLHCILHSSICRTRYVTAEFIQQYKRQTVEVKITLEGGETKMK